ncbi:MAG TPA: nucleotidyltransferase domain-containing protein [Microlunatus sp.]
MIRLLITSVRPHCDKITQGVIGLFELTFPDRVRGYYLRGSRASDTSITGSDIDLFVIFKDRFLDEAEFYRAHELDTYCEQISPILLECVLVGERGLRRNIYLALNLKLSTRLLYGEDIRPELPPFDPASYIRSVAHTPYFSYMHPPQRKSAGHLTYPLQHIAPDDMFFGYTQWKVPAADGTDQPSTKLLVASVGWTAIAIVALRTGKYVRDKAACANLYRTLIADEWTDLVLAVHDLCRSRWHYQIPDNDTDQQTLRELCNQALHFQNHYLTLYRK